MQRIQKALSLSVLHYKPACQSTIYIGLNSCKKTCIELYKIGDVVELVDTGDSKSPGESCASSSLAIATTF